MTFCFNPFWFSKSPKRRSDTAKVTYAQPREQAGLLVTTELEKALEECKARVARIARDCRASNRRFRDSEFDLELDKDRCLHGIEDGERDDGDTFYPADVQRVTRIFDKPEFFIDGAGSDDIHQGEIGDCWFVSALATMATCPGLIEKFCVARDEVVGVYGFIFFRDTAWVSVIIDDFVYTKIPKYEELSPSEKEIYHYDKEKYNASARKDGKGLYFARSGTQAETWVPLLEKAYAKLHGSYRSLSGGYAFEAIEDLTGGLSVSFPTKDILDVDQFWNDELLKANQDRLFGCFFDALDNSRNLGAEVRVNGLFPYHAYSVLRGVEVNGKRFVVVRNPWGRSEWTGKWADGSKEWTKEWLDLLPELGHRFGDDGQFLMEYSDFLETWQAIDRTLLFDSSWVMSSHWLEVNNRPLPAAYSFGDVSFTLTLPEASSTFIVLSQLDSRYWDSIGGIYYWAADFIVFRKGEKDYITKSIVSPELTGLRSVNCEVFLEAGDYVVHVRLDRHQHRDKDYFKKRFKAKDTDERMLSKLLNERAKSRSIATNFQRNVDKMHLEVPLEALAGQDLQELEEKAKALANAKAKKEESEAVEKKKAEETKESNCQGESQGKKGQEDDNDEKAKVAEEDEDEDGKKDPNAEKARKREEVITTICYPDGTVTTTKTVTQKVITLVTKTSALGTEETNTNEDMSDPSVDDNYECVHPRGEPGDAPVDEAAVKVDSDTEKENNSVFLGLKVYTHKNAPVVITGQLRQEAEITVELAL